METRQMKLTIKTMHLMGIDPVNEPTINEEVLYLIDTNTDGKKLFGWKIPLIDKFVDLIKNKLGRKKPKDGRIFKVEVVSSNLRFILYQPDTKMLFITFLKNRDVYVYQGVDFDTYTNLSTAQSKGKYFYENIRDKYNTTKLN